MIKNQETSENLQDIHVRLFLFGVHIVLLFRKFITFLLLTMTHLLAATRILNIKLNKTKFIWSNVLKGKSLNITTKIWPLMLHTKNMPVGSQVWWPYQLFYKCISTISQTLPSIYYNYPLFQLALANNTSKNNSQSPKTPNFTLPVCLIPFFLKKNTYSSSLT